jgi:murein DD-endopeptidase MepM/ murein hydrolase activator NlpD
MIICKPFKSATLNSITQGYSAEHEAIDFTAPYGTFLVAPRKCVVQNIRSGVDWGNKNEIELGYGIMLRDFSDTRVGYGYWHCLGQFPVEIGQIVEQGQIVAQMGNSGYVLSGGKYVPVDMRYIPPFAGTHVHYSMSIDNQLCNPLKYIDWDIPIIYSPLEAIQNILIKIGNLLKGRGLKGRG